MSRDCRRSQHHLRWGAAAKQTTTSIAGIYGATVASGTGVIIDSTGHLGTVQSSARFKDPIKPMERASQGPRTGSDNHRGKVSCGKAGSAPRAAAERN